MRSRAAGLAVALGVGMVLIASAPALARIPAACSGDVEKLCTGVEPGAGRMFTCLRSHGGQLSAECQQALKEVKQHAGGRRWLQQSRAWAGVCSPDIGALCKDIPAGAGRIAECLKAHQANLSAACKAALLPTPTN